jgi:hypothetical protein
MRAVASFPNLDLDDLLVSSIATPGSSPGDSAYSAPPLRPLRVAQLQQGAALPPRHRGRSPDTGRSLESPSASDLSVGFHAAFAILDADGDGVLAAADIKELCANMGLAATDEEARAREAFRSLWLPLVCGRLLLRVARMRC